MTSPSVYLWSLRPEAGLAIELRVTAENAAVARREVRRFLVEHDGMAWKVECVTREARIAPGTFVSTSVATSVSDEAHAGIRG